MSVLRGGASYASQGRISVTGHRAEPNEQRGRSMCRGYSACSGYNCRWWAAVALGGPVSINQPALNTRARRIARLADRSQLPRMRFARTIYVSRRITESVYVRVWASLVGRQNIVFSLRRSSGIVPPRRFSSFL